MQSLCKDHSPIHCHHCHYLSKATPHRLSQLNKSEFLIFVFHLKKIKKPSASRLYQLKISPQLPMECQQWYPCILHKMFFWPKISWQGFKNGTGYHQWTFSPSFLKLLILGLEPTPWFENQVSLWNLTPDLELSFTTWRGITDSSLRSQIPLRSWQLSIKTGIIHKLKGNLIEHKEKIMHHDNDSIRREML